MKENENLTTEQQNTEITVVNEQSIRDKIYLVRGIKVMLDFELAEIYGYETKNFNRQVKNNAEKFEGDEFMFKLNKKEFEEILRCKNFTSSWGGYRYLPYAFTEQGVYMLMTVLRGELATRQSRALVKAFKSMKDYIIENQGMIGQQEYLRLSLQVSDSIRDGIQMRRDLDELSENMKGVLDKLSDVVTKSEIAPILLELGQPEDKREWLFLNGQPMKADAAYIGIYAQAKKTVHIVDDYIGAKTLHLLQDVKTGVSVTVISDNKYNKLSQSDYQDFHTQFPGIPLAFIKTENMAHDRFIVLDYDTDDERIFHCGASSKDAGNRAAAITEFSDGAVRQALHDMVVKMLGNPVLSLS